MINFKPSIGLPIGSRWSTIAAAPGLPRANQAADGLLLEAEPGRTHHLRGHLLRVEELHLGSGDSHIDTCCSGLSYELL